MKRAIAAILLLVCLNAKAQYNNEWIDYNKTYYKFKVGNNGLYRIQQSTLQGLGLGSVPAEQFQLWRNGTEVSLFTSQPTGTLASSDYLEFYGRMNDGKPDTKLYRDPSIQLSDKWSLQTDTATYFLTVNPSGGNLRLVNGTNNVAGNTLPPDPYFMYQLSVNYKARLNPGFAQNVGEYVYSASYDLGEGWASGDVYSYNPLVDNYSNLYVSSVGPNPEIRIAASGNAQNGRSVRLYVNGTPVIDQQMNNFTALQTTATFPLGLIGKPTDTVRIVNGSSVNTDRMAVAKYEMTYPRTFNFGGNSLFEFTVAANANGNYLEIANVSYGAIAPILYDLTNGIRYQGDLSVQGLVRFSLPPSGDRELVLMSQDPSNLKAVISATRRDFVDYSQPSNQGDFMIISNPRLYTGPNGNAAENYRLYRSSPQGGGYHARVYDMDQLIDQFAFGIRQHPLSVKNFIRFARNRFSEKPKAVFLIGHGVLYPDMRVNESKPTTSLIDFVPTFGSPGSDNLLASEAYDPIPSIPIGRLSIINANELEIYLAKVKQYEAALKDNPQTVDGRLWMKNIVHAIGGGDIYLQSVIQGYMNANKVIAEDTLFGGNVSSFSKINSGSVQQITSEQLKQLFEKGIGLVTYFGHSSASILEFNLDDPYAYNNPGKYPVFLVNGCNAGNIFVFDTARLGSALSILSEKYVLANQRGCAAFIASTHYGIVTYLNIYTNSFYNAFSNDEYGKSVGEIHGATLQKMQNITGLNDYFARIHMEEMLLHGDPALPMTGFSKPDYVIEQPDVDVSPSFISVAENTFRIDTRFHNIGKAIGDSLKVLVKRELPDGTSTTLFNSFIKPLRNTDSLVLTVPINPLTDKGTNKITVTLDPDDIVQEGSESNNTVSLDVLIFEDEVRPVYPYPFSIVGKNGIKFMTNSANPISVSKQYVMEIDTTELFNSSFKKTQTVTSPGGLIEFDPNLTFTDSMVYYWRVAPVPTSGDYKWAGSSFVFLNGSSPGWNNSHYFQYLRSTLDSMTWNSSRLLDYLTKSNEVRYSAQIYPFGNQKAYLNEDLLYSGGCGTYLNSLEFLLINNRTGRPVVNQINGSEGDYHSLMPVCPNNGLNKSYPRWYYYNDPKYRKYAMDFLDSIPRGTLVIMSNYGSTTYNSNPVYIDGWQADTTLYGHNKSLYHKLMEIGLTKIDSFYTNRAMVYIFRKNADGGWEVIDQQIGLLRSDMAGIDSKFESNLNSGSMKSPVIGPSRSWKTIHWQGKPLESPTSDQLKMTVIGIRKDFTETPLYATSQLQKDTSISFIDASVYPYLRLEMTISDTMNFSPSQLHYLQVKYEPVPEGAIAPNLALKTKDSLDVGEPMDFQVAFKNVSDAAFDSMKVVYTITDQSNVKKNYIIPRLRPMKIGDTLLVSFPIDTKSLAGKNTLYLDINPANDQLEQFHFNNFLFKDFYVRADNYKPNLDVTFDGVHILNRDIISSKPHIQIKLEDNNKYMKLDDTSLLKVQVRYPDNSLHYVPFDNVVMKFIPSGGAAGSGRNIAEIDYSPSYVEDGEYELIVSGRDKSGNPAGNIEYKVVFQIINKAMISNLLNYPNPFTTSTAFVFTLTGSQVPSEFKIQIMTVTGKIVREITKTELGNIHVGRNITDFKWDGSDQFGQKLGNGIYLYRVITSLEGKTLDKYKASGDLSDKFFNAGYGKMYLMR